jgi:hypothetical protein
VDSVASGGRSVTLGSDFPGAGSRTWQPSTALVVLGAVAALGALTWAVLAIQPLDRLVAGFVAIVLAGVSVAGPRGLLVSGLRGTRIVPWSQVRGLAAATSSRLGLSTTTIEVDLVDDDLLVFGRTDLGADPAEVLAVLTGWRNG